MDGVLQDSLMTKNMALASKSQVLASKTTGLGIDVLASTVWFRKLNPHYSFLNFKKESHVLHAYSAFKSTTNYKDLFNYS